MSTQVAPLPVPSVGWWDLLAAEALKLRRSLTWVFVLLLPLLTVITGTVNYVGNQGALSAGWRSLTSQVTLFYALFFFSVAVALIVSAAWRPEHRGTSWNAMTTMPASMVRVVAAKTLVFRVPVAVMQVGLVVLTWGSGALVLGLPGGFPAGLLVSSGVTVIAALPLVAVQSLLAMHLRSFGASVALGLAGTMVGLGVARESGLLSQVWPYSLVTRAQILGSDAMANAGGLDWAGLEPVLAASLVSGLVGWGLLLLAARRR